MMNEQQRKEYVELLRQARSDLFETHEVGYRNDQRVQLIDTALSKLVQARTLLLRFG